MAAKPTNEITFKPKERRGKVTIGVPEAIEQAWKQVQEQAEKHKVDDSARDMLSDKVAEAVLEVQEKFNAWVSASTNGYSSNG